jgi:hypothetical protein
MGVFEISKKYGLTAEQRRDLRERMDASSEGLQKEAASDAASAFMYTLAGSTAGAAVAYGVPAAIGAIRNSRIRANRDKLLRAMMSAHPEIRNYSKRDIDLVYNSLSQHAPRMLEDPLLGGQVMLDALQRGNRMDISTLGNVSKLTGGSGLSEHEADATRMFAGGMGDGAKSYVKMKYEKKQSTSSSNKGGKDSKSGKGGKS